MNLLKKALSRIRPPVPVEDSVDVLVTVRDGKIYGVGLHGTQWIYEDITRIVHPTDRERLLNSEKLELKKYWSKVTQEMKL